MHHIGILASGFVALERAGEDETKDGAHQVYVYGVFCL
jgi:hypothetical protein